MPRHPSSSGGPPGTHALEAANGGRRDERAALVHYNRSRLYRDAVLHLAHRMATVPTAFREYYAWKLFLRKR